MNDATATAEDRKAEEYKAWCISEATSDLRAKLLEIIPAVAVDKLLKSMAAKNGTSLEADRVRDRMVEVELAFNAARRLTAELYAATHSHKYRR